MIQPAQANDARATQPWATPRRDHVAVVEAAPSPTVSVVIPALNEAENLPHVLPKLPQEYEVLVVDGHSTDGTAAVATELRPDSRIVSQDRRGKGNALGCGFAAATGDIIVMLDADGSARPEEIDRFVDILCRGADFAKGSRRLAGGGSADLTWIRRAGNRLLSGLVNLLFGTRYTDLCYGYNAFWAYCLPHLDVDCDGFEVETLMNIRAAKAGLVVVEVPSYEDLRLFGSSNLRAIRDGMRVLRTIVAERVRRRPRGNANGASREWEASGAATGTVNGTSKPDPLLEHAAFSDSYAD
jgi:glycosyltransferase involved in cell wall biosynthesis